MQPPWPHQAHDTATLLAQPSYLLGCEPGLGKTRTVLDAACRLYERREIDAVVIVCPANARSVWSDPDPVLGEVAKWMPANVLYDVRQYHAKFALPRANRRQLQLLVTNPEFIRRAERLEPLMDWCRTQRVMLVGDESWQWKNPQAQQTKAMMKLRACCTRAVLLNGTLGEPKEQYSQFAILDKGILGCKNWWAFRNRFCIMGGYYGKEITGYQREDEYHEKTAPYVAVRKIRDFLDIGAEPNRAVIDAALTPKTWKIYTDMAEELVAWLSETEVATAAQAAVKSMRLAQICNGFVGGVEGQINLLDGAIQYVESRMSEVGDEKLRALLDWLPANWDGRKLLIFTRFRADVERTAKALRKVYPAHEVCLIYGNQSEADRTRAKQLLAPGGDAAPAIVIANAQSGGAGLNFAAAHLCVFLANDFSLKTRLQAEGRVDRPGQMSHVTFADVVASGPAGQKTVDHGIVAALRKKESVSNWTLEQWKAVLS